MEPKPGRGRPALAPGDKAVSVSVSLPGRTYDQIFRAAQQQRVTVPEVIRQRLRNFEIKKT